MTEAEELCVSGALNSYYGERFNDMARILNNAAVSADVRGMVAVHIRQRYLQDIPHGIKSRVTSIKLGEALMVDGQHSLVVMVGLSMSDYQRMAELCSVIDQRNVLAVDPVPIH